jgi:hypothetical protein
MDDSYRVNPPMNDDRIDPGIINAVAAIAGSITAQILSTKQVTVRRMIGLGCAGALAGIFGGPSICKLAGITNETMQAGMHYAVGLTGIIICTAIIAAVESQSFNGILGRVFGQQLPQK